jgi:choline dehydrogenase
MMQPFSRGKVRLTSSPDAAPVVDPRYLRDARDVHALVAGLKIAREIGRASALAPWRAADDALQHYANQTMGSYFHPVGTCRMGIDEMSVVDPELRVHGISGLRIADGSIMPSIVSGNTNAVYAIAERAATLLGRSHGHLPRTGEMEWTAADASVSG